MISLRNQTVWEWEPAQENQDGGLGQTQNVSPHNKPHKASNVISNAIDSDEINLLVANYLKKVVCKSYPILSL